jgi:hypothetical protein
MADANDLAASFRGGAAIVTNDSADLARVCKAIWVGGTGAIKLVTVDGDTLTFAAVPVGFFNVRAKRVWATGTTATNLIAVY